MSTIPTGFTKTLKAAFEAYDVRLRKAAATEEGTGRACPEAWYGIVGSMPNETVFAVDDLLQELTKR